MGTLTSLFLMWPIPLAPTIRASWNSVVKLNVRYFGGHLDVTAGTLSDIACLATFQVRVVSALPLGILRLISLFWSEYLPGLHGSDGATMSGKNVDSFRTAIVRWWPKKMPTAKPHAVLCLL